jgi:hypothetical protein
MPAERVGIGKRINKYGKRLKIQPLAGPSSHLPSKGNKENHLKMGNKENENSLP